MAVHYLPVVAEQARTGDDVHEHLRRTWPAPVVTHRDADFLLDVFSR